LLKIEIKNLRSQRNLLARGSANTADVRQEVLQLNRVLVQERVRARALENEITTPMNVHRWRKLSGIDPDKAELLSKVQTLQKYSSTQQLQNILIISLSLSLPPCYKTFAMPNFYFAKER